MKKKIWTGLLGVFAAVLLLAGSGKTGLPGTAGAGPDSTLKAEAAPVTKEASEVSTARVHFIDVGQGDATLIQCGTHAMLIDAGDNNRGTAVQLYLKKQGVKSLDYLILTHPDADHIGGADVIITKFPIGRVFMADYEKENKTYQEVIAALSDQKLKWSTPSPGRSYALGTAKFTILAPCGSYEDPNNSSIALLFQNGDNSFLFTGDAEKEAEGDILEAGRSVKADVYKVGHHGSDTASGTEFLKAVCPEFAVISCAEGNSYGHPHAEVLNSLRSMHVKVFRTDEQGSIIAESDGTRITWNCAPSETWQSGERTGSAMLGQTGGGSGQKAAEPEKERAGASKEAYIGNKNNGKLHRSTCSKLPKEENRVTFDTRQDAVRAGYDDPCKICKP